MSSHHWKNFALSMESEDETKKMLVDRHSDKKLKANLTSILSLLQICFWALSVPLERQNPIAPWNQGWKRMCTSIAPPENELQKLLVGLHMRLSFPI